ncbi:PadR family transcriptional regulator [Tsukamurella paurometabola]|uniref:PadR family transcriptional regulator n=1 Tax=Tsukamurella paurometabola TaxID=2061 RepID=UPI00019F0F52|nr:PadR family transcriptional regulator [Tsukamurella paurometabola]
MLSGSPKRLTPLGIAALALLTEREMHPYEMFQTLAARRTDTVVKLRPGSLYHTVNRLAEKGFVESVGTEREGNRPERTTYRITRAGRFVLREELGEALATPAREYPAFPLALSEAHNLPADDVAAHLRSRIAVLQREAASLRAILAELTDHPRVVLIEVEYLATMREAEIAWLTELVDDVDTGTLEWKVTCDDD